MMCVRDMGEFWLCSLGEARGEIGTCRRRRYPRAGGAEGALAGWEVLIVHGSSASGPSGTLFADEHAEDLEGVETVRGGVERCGIEHEPTADLLAGGAEELALHIAAGRAAAARVEDASGRQRSGEVGLGEGVDGAARIPAARAELTG